MVAQTYDVIYKIITPLKGMQVYEVRKNTDTSDQKYGTFEVHISGWMNKQRIVKRWASVKQELKQIGLYQRFHDSVDGVSLSGWTNYNENGWMHTVLYVYKGEAKYLLPDKF